jgi:hypothetical protein
MPIFMTLNEGENITHAFTLADFDYTVDEVDDWFGSLSYAGTATNGTDYKVNYLLLPRFC